MTNDDWVDLFESNSKTDIIDMSYSEVYIAKKYKNTKIPTLKRVFPVGGRVTVKKSIPTNCVNCGAVLKSNECEYCGSLY